MATTDLRIYSNPLLRHQGDQQKDEPRPLSPRQGGGGGEEKSTNKPTSKKEKKEKKKSKGLKFPHARRSKSNRELRTSEGVADQIGPSLHQKQRDELERREYHAQTKEQPKGLAKWTQQLSVVEKQKEALPYALRSLEKSRER